ncbi:MAG: hypothetical protein ACP5OG_05855 [Candidatus Nanoarchaeia archaeon]
MNKKSMQKAGAALLVSLIIGIILFIILVPSFSSLLIEKQTYVLGEKIRLNLNSYGDYKLRIVTPSTSYLKQGVNGAVSLNLNELGDYYIQLQSKKGVEEYYFRVVLEDNDDTLNGATNNTDYNATDNQTSNSTNNNAENETENRIVLNKPVKVIKKINVIGSGSKKESLLYAENISVYKVNPKAKERVNFSLREINETHEKSIVFSESGDIEIEYYTQAPKADEKILSKREKQVKVSAPDELNYTNILAYTIIDETININEKEKIRVYWNEENKKINFNALDTNNNGLIDRVEWNVEHLSTQTFSIIIQITNAEHLDTNKNFISDIYSKVNALDDIWSETINENEYVRIKFERELTNINDITIYPRIVSGNPKVEVYQIGQEEKIAEFSNIVSNEYSKIYLTNLTNSQDSFDLKVVGGSIEFDYIVDPPVLEKIKTVEYNLGSYASGTETAIASAAWWQASTNKRIYLPENNVNVKSAFIILNGYTFSGVDLTAVAINLSNTIYNPVTALYGDQSGEQYPFWVITDITGFFSSFSNPLVLNTSARITGPTTGGLGMKLIITYTYSDDSSELLNTVKYPITANVNIITNTAYDVIYNASIKEANLTNVHDAWFEIQGTVDGISNADAKIQARVNTDTLSPYMHLETGALSTYDFRFYFNATGTSFNLNTNQTLRMQGADTAAIRGVGAELVVTYNYSINATRNTKTVSHFIGQGTTRNLNTQASFTKNISLPEDNIKVKAVWANVRSGYASETAGTTTLNASIDGVSAQNQAYSFDTESGGGSLGGYEPLIYDLSALKEEFDDGTGEVKIRYQYSQASNTPAGIDLYITYEYDANSTIQQKTVKYFGGQTTGLALSNTFTGRTWVPELDPSLVSGYIETTSTDTDATDPAQTTTIEGQSSVAVQVESAEIVFIKTLNGDANNRLNVSKQVNYSLVLSSATVTGGNQIIYLTYNYSIRDITSPNVEVILPIPDKYYNISQIYFNISTNENSTANYSLNSISNITMNANSSGTGFSALSNILSDGNYTIRFFVLDETGNQNYTQTRNFTIDTTLPGVEYGQGTQDYGYNSTRNWIYVNVTVNETNEVNISFYLYNNTNGLTLMNTTTLGKLNRTINWTNLADGVYYYNVSVTDLAMNMNFTQTYNINIDTKYPGIEYGIGTEENESFHSYNWIYVNVSVNETNEANITFLLTDSSFVEQRRNFYTTSQREVNWTGLMNGGYYYNVSVCDFFGQCNNTITRKITLDSVFPQIFYGDETKINGYNSSKNFIYVNVSVIEENEGNLTFYLYNNTNGFTLVNTTLLGGGNRTINFTDLQDGVYYYNVSILDKALNFNVTETYNINIDTIYPQIEWGFGTENNNTNFSRNWIYVNVSVNETNEANITFGLYDSEGIVSEYVSFEKNRTINFTELNDGVYYYNVSIEDYALNINFTITRKINLDTIGPNIIIVHPEPRPYSRNHTIPLNYSVSDNVVGYEDCWWRIDDGAEEFIICGQNTTFNATEGEHTLHFYSNDSLNNIGYKNVTFSISTLGPAISLNYPRDNGFLNHSDVTFNYTPRDPEGVSTCYLYGNWTGEWQINQTDTEVENWTANYFNIPLIEDGSYFWNIWCNDSNNLPSFSLNNFTFTIDTVYPLIDYALPTENNNTNFSRNWIYVNVSVIEENEANITFGLYDINGIVFEYIYYDNTRQVNWTGLEDGVYYYNVSIYDSAMHINYTQTRKILLDTTAPSVIINFPEAKLYSNPNIIFNVTTEGETRECNYTLDNGATNYTMQNNGGKDFNASQTLSDGSYNAIFYCSDYLDNLNDTETISFSLDASSPLVQYGARTEENNSYFNRDWIYVNVSVIEENEANITFKLFDNNMLESRSNFYTTSQRDVNWTGVSEGEYYYNVTVYDTANNFNYTQTRKITLDTTYPVVEYGDYTEIYDANFSRTWIYVNVSVIEENEANITYYLYNDTNERTLVNVTILGKLNRTINFTELGDGTYYYNVTLTDLANNKYTTNEMKINLDTTPPQVDYGTGTEESASESERNWIYVNLSIIEEHFSNMTFYLYNTTNGLTLVNSSDFFSITYDINFTDLNSANITYYYNASVYDAMGNKNTTSTNSIKLIDTTPPNISIISPQNISYDYNESLTLGISIIDINPIGKCWYKLNGGSSVEIPDCESILFDAPEGGNRIEVYANDSLGNTNSTNISFVANSSLAFTYDWKVQSGIISSLNGNQVAPISKVDRAKSIILLDVTGSVDAPGALQVISRFVNTTTIQFLNYAGGAVQVEYEVVTGPGLSVKRGEYAFSAGEIEFNISNFGEINMSDSFIIVNNNLNSTTSGDNVRGFWTGKFLNSTLVRFRRDQTGTNGNLSYQIVSWSGAKVQNGTTSVAAISALSSLSSPVNLTRSFLIFSNRVTTATQPRYVKVGGFIHNTTTIAFYRGATSGTMTMEWFLVEPSDVYTRKGNIALAAGVSGANSTINPKLFNRTIAFRIATNSMSSVNTAANSRAYVASKIVNDSAIQFRKANTATATNTSFQVIEVWDYVPPEINLLNPRNNENISGNLVSAFNFSINDSSGIINCSLYGNWTGSFVINSTMSSIQPDEIYGFYNLYIPQDNYYIWNVECTDIYGNKARNITNFTFTVFYDATKPVLFNISQSLNDGSGNVTLFWNASNHTRYYNIYYSSSMNSTWNFLNNTNNLNYTDSGFKGNIRRFYLVEAWNPVSSNFSDDYFGAHVYTLRRNISSRNWIAFPTNFSYMTNANNSLREIRNATTFNMWNKTIQKRVACNFYSCPNSFECTDTNCNFSFGNEQGIAYEVYINNSAPSEINWSGVGIVYDKTSIYLIKNLSSYGKNWIGMYANTSYTKALDIMSDISFADASTRWDAASQKSQGYIKSPYPWVPYIGNNFNIKIEEGYEVSVTQSQTWNQE